MDKFIYVSDETPSYSFKACVSGGEYIAGRNINKFRYADDATFMAESKELKSLLMKVKEENEKVGLKLNI